MSEENKLPMGLDEQENSGEIEPQKKEEKKAKSKKSIFEIISMIQAHAKLCIGIAIVVIVGGVVLKFKLPDIVSSVKEAIWGTEVIVSESTLTELLKISELSTLSYKYSAVASVYEDEEDRKEDDVYDYAWYDSTIKLGIDFLKVDVKVNDEKKEITLTLPQIEVMDVIVDQKTMKYFDTSSTDEDFVILAKKACKEDAVKNATTTELTDAAKKNTEDTVRSLIAPVLDSGEENYKVSIEWGDSDEK